MEFIEKKMFQQNAMIDIERILNVIRMDGWDLDGLWNVQNLTKRVMRAGIETKRVRERKKVERNRGCCCCCCC